MNTQTLKLKNQTLTLPKDWRGKEIFVRKYNDTIIIKKVEKPVFLLFDKDTEKNSEPQEEKLPKKILKKPSGGQGKENNPKELCELSLIPMF